MNIYLIEEYVNRLKKSDIERLKDGGEIDTEMEKFLTYALEKLA